MFFTVRCEFKSEFKPATSFGQQLRSATGPKKLTASGSVVAGALPSPTSTSVATGRRREHRYTLAHWQKPSFGSKLCCWAKLTRCWRCSCCWWPAEIVGCNSAVFARDYAACNMCIVSIAVPLKRVSFVAINMSTTTERQECGHNGVVGGCKGGWAAAVGGGAGEGRAEWSAHLIQNTCLVFVLSLWLLPSASALRFFPSPFFLCISALGEIPWEFHLHMHCC